MGSRRPGKTEILLALAPALAAALAMAWLSLPEHRQQLAVMRVTAWAHRVSARLARLQGHAGMGDELAGRPQARQQYAAAYRLSRLRDATAAALDRMRP